MNLKSVGFGAAIAATVSVGAISTATPANALTVQPGDVLNFNASSSLTDVGIGSIAQLQFAGNEAVVTTPSAPVFGVAAPPFASAQTFTIGNLNLRRTAANTWQLEGGTVPNWLTGLANGVQYTLESMTLNQVGGDLLGSYAGFFTPPVSGVPGFGSLTTQGNFTIGSSFSSTVTAVPTPALLPGLLGFGVAAFRRRKGEATEAEKETVEVKA